MRLQRGGRGKRAAAVTTLVLAAVLGLVGCPSQEPLPKPATEAPILYLAAAALGETTDGYPSDQERMVLVLTNLARHSATTPNGNACGDWTQWLATEGISVPKRPLIHSHPANQAARFTSEHLQEQGCFQHESCCVLGISGGGQIGCTAPASCGGKACGEECTGGTSTQGRYGLLGYAAWSGENIAMGQGSAYAAWCAWMNSEGHRRNIYSNHTELGVGAFRPGAAANGCSGWYWTQAFGSRSEAVPRIPAATALYSPPQPLSAVDVSFLANFYDETARAPQRAMAVVKGHCLELEQGWGVEGNGTFEARFTEGDALPAGCHPYYFLFVDADAERHTYPSAGSLLLSLGAGQSCPSYFDAAAQLPADCETGVQTCTAGERRGCYTGGTATLGQGQCVSGYQVCKNGFWGACRDENHPAPETCDGRDNDCDGEVDEGLDAALGTCSASYERGECEAGEQRCIGGGLVCVPSKSPVAELCDGKDNDCDGIVDDGFGVQTCGEGECFRLTPSCIGGTPVSCVAGQPSPEVADTLDNDCDGIVDDEVVACGAAGTVRPCYSKSRLSMDGGTYPLQAPCGTGLQTCQADGGWGTCTGERAPSAESCDGQDNDCNGVVDDNAALGWQRCGTGACFVVTTSCKSGKAASCAPKAPAVESCDGADDDCDGVVDESCACRNGTTMGCSTVTEAWKRETGSCRPGVRTCVGGQFTACEGEVVPSAELCNGLDDDCDGEVDNACVAAADAGTEGNGPTGEGPEDGAGGGGRDRKGGGCTGAGADAAIPVVAVMVGAWLSRRQGWALRRG